MKVFGIQFSFLLLLGFCSIARCESAMERVDKLKAEIARVEAACCPTNGTTRVDVEKQFGSGQPAVNSKIPPKAGIPADSPYRAYDFCAGGTLLGTLFVRYDERWRVAFANYTDPYSIKGRPAGSTVTPEKDLQQLEPRLQQLRRIAVEYEKRFDHK